MFGVPLFFFLSSSFFGSFPRGWFLGDSFGGMVGAVVFSAGFPFLSFFLFFAFLFFSFFLRFDWVGGWMDGGYRVRMGCGIYMGYDDHGIYTVPMLMFSVVSPVCTVSTCLFVYLYSNTEYSFSFLVFPRFRFVYTILFEPTNQPTNQPVRYIGNSN